MIIFGIILFILGTIFGFIAGYFFIRKRCCYGGYFIIDDKLETSYAELKNEKLIKEGSYITLKIIRIKK